MKLRVLYVVLLIQLGVYAQCPAGDVSLSSQEDVDEFVETYGSCETISGNFTVVTGLSTVGGDGSISSNIVDTSGLNTIRFIQGDLMITIESTALKDFKSLERVSGKLSIINAPNLTTIEGFHSLRSVGSMDVARNSKLEQIIGFSNLTRVLGNLEIGTLIALQSIQGFDRLTQVDGRIDISNNLVLESIPSFDQLTNIGIDLSIDFNPALPEVNGFGRLAAVGNDFNIDNVIRVIGFDMLKTVGRYFDLRGSRMESIPTFSALEEVGGWIRIFRTSIVSFEGFNSLISIGRQKSEEKLFRIRENPELISVRAFNQLVFIGGNLEVRDNAKLDDCRWICDILNRAQIVGDIDILDNKGNCSTSFEVIELCDDDFDNDGIPNAVDLDDDNDGILDTDEGNGVIDTDGDGYPDTKDLDADGDQCFDVIEAGFSDPNADGILGDLPNEVDASGKIKDEPTGYTKPADNNRNGTYDFLEKSTLDPGQDTYLEVCRTDGAFDLLTRIGGTPDPGGVWTPSLLSGNDRFDPAVDKAGVYTYRHSSSVCGDRTAQIEIAFITDVTAGKSTELVVCDTTKEINLIDVLGGTPTPGGTWTPALSSGTNMFNPILDTASSYEYAVVGQRCGTVRARVAIRKSKKPYAGNNTSVTLCEFEKPVDLFELLGDDVDRNGVWSNQLKDGIFDPSIHPSGIYTYTVDNGACGVDLASINVQIIQDSALDNVNIKVNDFLARNNNIVVNVYATRQYEYSLDGRSYQSSNVLTDVKGGLNTIYVRGVDGCEFYQKEVYVRTFPTFFTPNGDGRNDYWYLKDFPESRYTISIYNRYGALIKRMNQDEVWDGTLNGKPLNPADFWFQAVTEKGEVLHGNFSLLRN